MSLNLIELNDTAVRVTRDGVVVCISPGIALVDDRGVCCGAAAQTRAQLQPRDVYQHFWQQLNEVPLPDARRHCRHHADLAYHHLASVLDAAGRPREAVLVVPGHYDDRQLALLLGIAQALDLKVEALVDSSVAMTAGCAPAGRYTVVEMHRHHISLSTVQVGAEVARLAWTDIEQAGFARFEAAAVDLVAAALLSQAHFDALHDAGSAQLLHDHLPRWLAQANQSSEVTISVDYHGRRFGARLMSRDFVHVTSMVLASVADALIADTTLLVHAALAALPGALDQLAPARALPTDACYRAIATHRPALASTKSGVSYVTQLPATRAPLFENDVQTAAGLARSPARRAPNHILAGHAAHALGPSPLYLHADGRIAASASGPSCAIAVQNEQVVLRANGIEAHINGVPAAAASVVRAGDHITLAGGRALFVPIIVSASRAP